MEGVPPDSKGGFHMTNKMFNNESILSWLKYFSNNMTLDLEKVKLLDITGQNQNLIPTVKTNRSVLVFTDAGHPEIFYSMWDAGLGNCDIWYNIGSDPVGEIKHNKLSEMINRGINASAAMMVVNPDAQSTYMVGLNNDSFSVGSIRYVASEIRAIIMNKMSLDEEDVVCAISGESIAVEAAIAVPYGKVIAVEYKNEDRITMAENKAMFGLQNVKIIKSLEDGYPKSLPVPTVAFLVSSDRMDAELSSLLAVNPAIRIVVYTLEFDLLTRIPSLFRKHGIREMETLQIAISKLGKKDMFEMQPAPWLTSGLAGASPSDL